MSSDHAGTRWIDLILARSGDLRAAGVLSIAVDGCAATLSPLDVAPPITGEIDAPDTALDGGDSLYDPASYPGGVVPGFTIEKLEIED